MVEILSNVSSTMKKIYEAHWETGNEIGSRNGMAIVFAIRRAMETKKTNWHIEYKNGKRNFVYNPNITKPIGDIVNKRGVMIETRLQNFVQWRTYASKGTTVVAAPMKSGTTEIRENGKVVSRTRVDSVGKGSIDILQKLNFGLNESSNKINRVNNPFNWQGKPSAEQFKGKHTKAMNFVEEGRRNALGKINENNNQGFKDALRRRENIKEPLKKVV